MLFRTGLGYDLHRLVPGRKLIIGGVKIPFELGEDGHSDGDALLHAITDALLGASCLGDIGEFFPPSDLQWKDAQSSALLAHAWHIIQAKDWHIQNIDCVIALQKPKILPYRDLIRQSIAQILSIPIDSIFVKAKTGEGIGPVGKSEAIEVWASCLISKNL